MKKTLDAISKNATEGISVGAECSTARKSSRSMPSSSRVYNKQCIFCPPGKTCKYLKGQNTREPLVQCVDLRADESVRKAAIRQSDDKILAIVSRGTCRC